MPDDINQQVCPQTLAWGTLKALHPVLYKQWAQLCDYVGTSPQHLAVIIVQQHWTDGFKHLPAEERRAIGKDLLTRALHRCTARNN